MPSPRPLALGALLFANVAHAQSLDLGFACGTPITADISAVGSSSRVECSVDYSNTSGADLTNVVLSAEFHSFDQAFDLAPKLPDGVEGLTSSNNASWEIATAAYQVSGSPSPSFNSTTHTVSLNVGNVPDQTTSEVFFTLATPLAFPKGDIDVDIRSTVNGSPDNATTHTLRWEASSNQFDVRAIGTAQADRNYVGGTLIGDDNAGRTVNAYTDVQIEVYLPYWDGAAWRADGSFDANAGHIPVIADDQIEARLALQNRFQVPTLAYDLAPNTALDTDSNRSAPTSGANANKLIIYDPANNTLTGNPGVEYAEEFLSDVGYGNWRLRWRGDFNDALPASALASNIQIPVQSCRSDAETGPVTVGDANNCVTDTTRIGTESLSINARNVRCPGNGSILVGCHDENRPYAPNSTGITVVEFQNNSSLDGNATVYAQMPGSVADGSVTTLTGLVVGTGNFSPVRGVEGGNVSADAARIFVSGGADFDGTPNSTSTDVTGRDLPASGTVWEECTVEVTTSGSYRCDLTALTLPVEDVQQIKVEIDGMRQHHYSLGDHWRFDTWALQYDWDLSAVVSASIDSVTSNTDTANTSFGEKVRFELDTTEAGVISADDAQTSEVTRETLADFCGVNPRGGSTTSHPGCGNGATQSHNTTVLTEFNFSWGIENAGTIANMTTPSDLCVPIANGVRLENTETADRFMPSVYIGNPSAGTASLTKLPTSAYGYTYTATPADPAIEAEYCIQVTDGSYTLQPGEVIAVHVVARLVPGAAEASPMQFTDATRASATAQGEDASGSAVELSVSTSRAWINLSGAGRVETSSAVSPGTTVGATTRVCYDYEHDAHAFDTSNTDTLDPGWATLPAYDSVSYTWISDAAETDPASLSATNSGTTTFNEAISADTLGVWVHTSNTPTFGDSTTLGANGWQLCHATTCDATALAILGLTTADVRWVAFEYGDLLITDAEPRGVAPFDGNSRVNNVYTANVCVFESGNGDAATIRTVMETYSSNLLTVVAEPVDVTVDPDCPDGLAQETNDLGQLVTGWPCDNLDNDCDGVVDEDTPVGEACTEGVGECADTGVWECIVGNRVMTLECSADPTTGVDELCDGLDNDCDSSTDEIFTLNTECTIGQGECTSTGTTVCTQDQTGTECDATVIAPAPSESCDNLDRDCDGSPLNGFSEVGGECTVGVGECATTGNWVCLSDGSGSECDALEGLAAAEVCDGTDGNCDGIVDGSLADDNSTTISACADTDNDGLTDHSEYFGSDGTDYLDPDTDGDGVQDGTESGLTSPELPSATDTDVFVPDADPDTTTDPTDADTDEDGLLDGTEDANGNGAVEVGVETDPLNPDTDADGLYDGTESGLTTPESPPDTDTSVGVYVADADDNSTTDPLDGDTDGDGISDGIEDKDQNGAVEVTETDPNDDDSDDDGLLDGTEDANQDGIVDSTETDPLDNDSDDDNIQDGTESGIDTPQGDDTDTNIFVPDADTNTQTDPLVADTDTGTTPDGVEDSNYNGAYEPNLGECDPLDVTDDLMCIDSDGDGLSDQEEDKLGTDPFDDDTDDDCITDGTEVTNGTDPLDVDSDDDGVQDGTESGVTEPEGNDTDTSVCVPDEDPTTTTDPLDDDTDDDCIIDGNEDADGDGAVDATETDPEDVDSDDDGLQDGMESSVTAPQGTGTDTDICEPDTDPDTGTDPLDDDTDDDGLTDGEEDSDADGAVDDTETDPNDPDTDDGGVSDGDEVERGSDPLAGEDDFPIEEPPEQWAQGGLACQTGGSTPWWLALVLILPFLRRKEVA